MAKTTTQYVTFQGKANWVKVYKPNKYDKWSLDLYLDANQVERFKSYNTKTHLKKDDDGYYVSFTRPTEKLFKGKRQALPLPIVVDKEGKPTTVAIGNGSDLTITCELYPYTPPRESEQKWAIRLQAIRIDNLVPFEMDSFPEEERVIAEQLAKQPAPATW